MCLSRITSNLLIVCSFSFTFCSYLDNSSLMTHRMRCCAQKDSFIPDQRKVLLLMQCTLPLPLGVVHSRQTLVDSGNVFGALFFACRLYSLEQRSRTSKRIEINMNVKVHSKWLL
jgi:hypothetical protein